MEKSSLQQRIFSLCNFASLFLCVENHPTRYPVPFRLRARVRTNNLFFSLFRKLQVLIVPAAPEHGRSAVWFGNGREQGNPESGDRHHFFFSPLPPSPSSVAIPRRHPPSPSWLWGTRPGYGGQGGGKKSVSPQFPRTLK